MLVSNRCTDYGKVPVCLCSASDWSQNQKLWFFLLLPFSFFLCIFMKLIHKTTGFHTSLKNFFLTHADSYLLKFTSTWEFTSSCIVSLTSYAITLKITWWSVRKHTGNCTKLYVTFMEQSRAVLHYNGRWILDTFFHLLCWKAKTQWDFLCTFQAKNIHVLGNTLCTSSFIQWQYDYIWDRI